MHTHAHVRKYQSTKIPYIVILVLSYDVTSYMTTRPYQQLLRTATATATARLIMQESAGRDIYRLGCGHRSGFGPQAARAAP
jgi:hypothetical protein